jgi:adenosylhomocysteine nucleosidase
MNDIIVLALKAEAPDLFQYANVFEIGVGKVNAAINTATLIERYKPQRIINLGTAGCISTEIKPNGTYRCTHFSQRDVILGGCVIGPQADELLAPIVTDSIGYRVSTGDNFVTDATGIDAEFVDMEAFAIAKACKNANIEFICYKHISDMADENAKEHFQENVQNGEQDYIHILNMLSVTLVKKEN